jgi:hypothetical protein
MTLTIRLIATIYGILGAMAILIDLYEAFVLGEYGTLGIWTGLFLLVFAYGLATFRRWARLLALGISAFTGLLSATFLIAGLGQLSGYFDRGLYDRPAVACLASATCLAFALVQGWALIRPRGERLFYARGA